MYVPRTNAEERGEVLAAFMHAHPLATLVSIGPAGELWATHLPVVFDPARGPHGTIEGHVARANRHHVLVRAAAALAGASELHLRRLAHFRALGRDLEQGGGREIEHAGNDA